MATYKIVNGDYTIQTLNVGDSITLTSALGASRADIVVDGNLTVTGNTSLTGNLSVSQIFSGNSNVQVLASGLGGNVTVGVYGTSNIAVFANTGAYFSGVSSATGNVTGANVNTGGLVSATGNVNGGNVNSAGNITITRDASVTQPTIRFADIDTTGTANTVIGALEWYSGDISTPGARVSTAIRSTYTDGAGNSKIEFLTGTTTTPGVVATILPSGNVGIANANPTTTFGVTGTAYVSGNVTSAANITGGNILTAGIMSSTGNATAGNIITSGLITATGNINGANVNVTTGITVGSSGLTATGNVRGGNIVSDAQVSAVGNITGDNLNTQGRVSATGNVVANNIQAGNIVSTVVVNATGNITATGNVTGANLVTGGIVTATGTITGGNLVTVGAVSATSNIATAGFFIGDGGFLSNVTAVSNVAAQQIANGTSVLAVASANGNIFATINAIGNVLVMWPGGVNVTGIFSATGNVVGANVNATANVSAVGNVNAGNIFTSGIANIGTLLTNNINASALTSGTVGTDRLTGTYVINVTGNVSGTAATVTNAAQSNITSLGTLTSLAVTGNVTAGNILGGANVNATTHTGTTVSVTGNITGGNLSGTSIVGTLTTAAQNNITSVGTLTSMAVTGNVTAGNLSGTSIVGTLTTAAQTNITSVGTLSSLSATGNITGGNLVTTGTITTSGNVTSVGAVFNDITVYNNANVGNLFSRYTNGTVMYIQGSNSGTAGVGGGNLNVNGGQGNASSGGAVVITGGQGFSGSKGGNVEITGGLGAGTGLITGGGYVRLAAGGSLGLNIGESSTLLLLPSTGSNVGGVLYLSGGNGVNTNTSGGNVYVTGGSGTGTGQPGNVVIRVSEPTVSGATAQTATDRVIVSNAVVNVAMTTASTSTTTGALVVAGGTGVAGNLYVGGAVAVSSITHLGTNAVGNIGSASSYFNQVFATATTALYADLAEKYSSDATYPVGTVVSFGGEQEITISSARNDRRVAGVISDKPSHLMNAGLESEHTAIVALQGRVPCLVCGPIKKGDMMVSAGDGRAVANNDPLVGAVIGKALENFDGDLGTIEVVVGRI